MTDPIADMLTQIRNALMSRHHDVSLPYSKMKHAVAKIFEREGFIAKAQQQNAVDQTGPLLVLRLKYKGGERVIRSIRRISRPGRRVYLTCAEIPHRLPSLGILVISTSRGLLTNQEAKKQKVGGEVLCEIN